MLWYEAPSAKQYYTDGFALYGTVGYPGDWEAKPDKSETYSVEGDNAELRHYLARLVRRSRCFSRCLQALSRAVDLFVYYWNQRQRWNRENPKYKRDIRDFIKAY
jgi:IS1 family transposase